jgi:hypothetical protein
MTHAFWVPATALPAQNEEENNGDGDEGRGGYADVELRKSERTIVRVQVRVDRTERRRRRVDILDRWDWRLLLLRGRCCWR